MEIRRKQLSNSIHPRNSRLGRRAAYGVLNYWGGFSQNILAELRDQGYTIFAPSVGPLSSNWERACEAFAQITGTITDYGIARSLKFGHAQFGRNHSGNALVPGFMSTPNSKINLVGHSMGGPTQRLLTHLLTFGSPDEMDTCERKNVACSPLFWTNKTTSYVKGVFAISCVHQGSVYNDYLQSNAQFLKFFKNFILILIAGNEFDSIHIYDMQLDHWNLTQGDNELFFDYLTRILQSPWVDEQSNGLFDLSTAGLSNPLLSFVKNSPSTTYFSVASLTTKYINGTSIAETTTSPFFVSSANVIGCYNNTNFPVLKTYTRRDWRQNDGQVAVASARGPDSGFIDFIMDLRSEFEEDLVLSSPLSSPLKGIYNYVGALDNTDHFQITGLFGLPGAQNNLFNNIIRTLTAIQA
ncbi:hypothetical protein HK100_009255 [Physocladia obscura]|uniref:Lipase-like C-terminal domain-containing protein n=1 Tax=Physocladia obscura TaxID=109957 RepID=A0AAD5ST89_9FUNG|nr:hypothetical protein HK100_009255 [Physocladia obscura]